MEPRKRFGHPPNLKGKEIGLYYAKLGKKKRENKEIEQRSIVTLDPRKGREIANLLEGARSEEPVASTSHRHSSFAFQYRDHLIQSQLSEDGNNENVSSVYGLQRNPSLDEQFHKEHLSREQQSRVQSMLAFRKKLPAFKMSEEIVDVVERNQVVVISGETGCGKTTQVTQFILDSYIKKNQGSVCRVVCTQPRRISAITVAERVAEERGETCNMKSTVGWQVRLENKLPRKCGSILYCTTGILIQQLQHSSNLSGVSHIILDEIHERDLDTDFVLIVLKDLLVKRPDLKLILMSATLNAELFATYFDNCPMIHIPGFTYPVTEYYLEDVLEMTGYVPPAKKNQSAFPRRKKQKNKHQNMDDEKELVEFFNSLMGKYSERTIESLRFWDEKLIDVELATALVTHICRMESDGAILVFMPSWELISSLHNRLTSERLFNSSRFLILPLHSMMPTVNQKEVFERPPQGVRKIVIATNIAETSITIDDVVFVIDCGKIKISNFDEKSNIVTLQPEWVALANSQQRRGRAGRVQPGICYHLYTRYRETKLEQYQLPEMLRTRLETLILKIKILKLGKAEAFLQKALNPPSPKVLEISLNLLESLNALDCHEYLTPLGFHLARLPLDPLTGRMILFGAMFSCLDPILTVAASLSFKDAFIVPLGQERLVDDKKREMSFGSRSDHLMLARALAEWEIEENDGSGKQYCWDHFLSVHTLRMLVKLKKQFAQYLESLKFLHCSDPKHPDFNRNSGNRWLLKAIVCAGLYPNVAQLKDKQIRANKQSQLYTNDSQRVSIHPKSVNFSEKEFKYEWMVYYQKVKGVNINLHDTTEVHPYSLLFFGGKITTEVDRGCETVVIDDWIRFHCAAKTAKLVMTLRESLDKVLEQKIQNPGVLSTDPTTQEGAVLHSIVELITSEGYGR